MDAVYRPGRHVGGDLYDVVPADGTKLVIYVADASGHGVSAAMHSVVFKQRLGRIREEEEGAVSPAEVLAAVNRALLAEVVAPGAFITAAYLVLDVRTGIVTAAVAGHPPLLWVKADGEAHELGPTGPALALDSEATYGEHRIRLQADDLLLLYTDGLATARNGETHGVEGLVRVLKERGREGVGLLRELAGSGPGEAPASDRDDVTLLLLRARPGPCVFDNGEAGVSGQARGEVPGSPVMLRYGEGRERTFLTVEGKGTWMQAQTFHRAALDVVDSRRPLTVDLARCDYLDSTFLGTLHEVVARARERNVPVRIQGACSELRAQFEELGLRLVLEQIPDRPETLPDEKLTPLGMEAVDPDRSRLRILRAHEILASLSEENRREFSRLVDSLRGELGRPPDERG